LLSYHYSKNDLPVPFGFQVKAQRDDLERDVENLCMQNGNSSIFSRSAVVSERIYAADKELGRLKGLVNAHRRA
jgi:hypothetical protein